MIQHWLNVGFGLHLLTILWPVTYMDKPLFFGEEWLLIKHRRGIMTGLIVGIALWAILFVPLATFGIQPKLDSFAGLAPNQYIYEISNHFEGLYPLVVFGSMVFHLVYGLY